MGRRKARLGVAAGALALLTIAGVARAQDAGTTAKAGMDREGSYHYLDARLKRKPVMRGWHVYASSERMTDFDYGPHNDPKQNVEYPFRLQVESLWQDDPAKEVEQSRVFVIHYLRREDQKLARRVGSVLGRLYGIGMDYLGVGVTGKKYVNVWLTPDEKAGGEEYQGNIYLYGIDEPRAPAEWVRELAHEYGHLTLPQFGPFEQPEKWGNGYLGERLYLKWMLVDNQQKDVWFEPIDADGYMKQSVLPLRDRFSTEGPSSPVADRTDAEGMNFFIGEMMTLEAEHGPDVLKQIFAHVASPRPQHLTTALATLEREPTGSRFPIQPDAVVASRSRVLPASAAGAGPQFQKASYWVYMIGGPWQVNASTSVPDVAVSLDGAQLQRAPGGGGSWTTPILPGSGWHRLEFAVPENHSFGLTSIEVAHR